MPGSSHRKAEVPPAVEVFGQEDVQALLRLSPGRNILGYSNLLRLLAQPYPQER